jgi:HAD superfamily hydrolase (TIGR01484 family)
MRPISETSTAELRDVTLVLTDMDDTLTFRGKLAARTYTALERLESAGVRVVPVTAAPAGWCDQMVRMWPVTAVIGENGGLSFSRAAEKIDRRFWLDDAARKDALSRLTEIARSIASDLPTTLLSDDQPFRQTTLAFERPASRDHAGLIAKLLADAGASVTLNSIWVLGWFGGYDKLSATRRFLPEVLGLNVDTDIERIVYVGDSANDAPMFAHFPKSAGVSTVTEHRADIPRPPTWITQGAGGDGFVEVAEAILRARQS